MKNFFILLALLPFLSGCFAKGASSGPYHEAMTSWIGASVGQMLEVWGPPDSQEGLADGSLEYSWRRSLYFTGPPRTYFGPNGKIRTRPGLVTKRVCLSAIVVGPDGLVRGFYTPIQDGCLAMGAPLRPKALP